MGIASVGAAVAKTVTTASEGTKLSCEKGAALTNLPTFGKVDLTNIELTPGTEAKVASAVSDAYDDSSSWLPAFRTSHPELKNIPDGDLEAVRGYTGSDYIGENSALQSANPVAIQGLEYKILGIAEALDDMRKVEPPVQSPIYRGTQIPKAEADTYNVGAVIELPAFTSSSTNESISHNFGGYSYDGNVSVLYKIENEGGAVSIRDLSGIPSEEEALFAPGTRFVITDKSVDPSTGAITVSVKQIPYDDARPAQRLDAPADATPAASPAGDTAATPTASTDDAWAAPSAAPYDDASGAQPSTDYGTPSYAEQSDVPAGNGDDAWAAPSPAPYDDASGVQPSTDSGTPSYAEQSDVGTGYADDPWGATSPAPYDDASGVQPSTDYGTPSYPGQSDVATGYVDDPWASTSPAPYDDASGAQPSTDYGTPSYAEQSDVPAGYADDAGAAGSPAPYDDASGAQSSTDDGTPSYSEQIDDTLGGDPAPGTWSASDGSGY